MTIHLVSRPHYEQETAATRAERMQWWHDARFGMFVHLGLYSVLGRHESALATECIPWEADAQNQMVRQLQPHILINDRSQPHPFRNPAAGDNLLEDFTTPEGHVTPQLSVRDRGWEACMTFNDVSWGYMHGAEVDAWRGRDILKMLGKACAGAGNLIVNIGPLPDGSVPPDAIEPLQTVGRWLARHGEAVFGKNDSCGIFPTYCGYASRKGNSIYFWRHIWAGSEQGLGGFAARLNAVTCLTTGQPVEFCQDGWRIRLLNLPETCPEPEAGVAVYRLDFDSDPVDGWQWLPTSAAVQAGRPL